MGFWIPKYPLYVQCTCASFVFVCVRASVCVYVRVCVYVCEFVCLCECVGNFMCVLHVCGFLFISMYKIFALGL